MNNFSRRLAQIRLFATWSALLVLAACTAPQTLPEYRNFIEKNAFSTAQHFKKVPGGLNDVQRRFESYATTCMRKSLSEKKCGSFTCSDAQIVAQFFPEIFSDQDGVHLTVKIRNNDEAKENKGGVLILLAEVDRDMTGHVYAPKVGYGDVSGTAKAWMMGTDNRCPSLGAYGE